MNLEWKVHVRSFPTAPRGGDTGLVIPLETGAVAALVDATGHGLAAYSVAQKARKTLLQSSLREPDIILYELHEALTGTIGAAISVARIREGSLEFSGVGNVNASVNLHPMLVRTGIVGQRMRTPEVVTVPFPENTWLVMYTDGISTPRSIPPGSAETAARKMVEAQGSDHDDAGVLLARWSKISP